MSTLIRCRSRFSSIISGKNRQFSSAQPSPKESTISSSSTILGDQSPPPPPNVPPPHVADAEKSSLRFLKYGLIAAATGGVSLAGYASYAYSLDEVEHKTEALRASTNFTVEDDASSIDKFQTYLRAAAMIGPAKLVDVYIDLRRLIEEHVRGFTEPTSEKLLPDLLPFEQTVNTLVLDLNETLIYSDWKRDRGWRTFKRPGVDDFLWQLAQYYEIVVYSDQLNMFVDPVVERLDQKHCIRYKLSRGATKYVDGKHYRDLSRLNRDPAKVLYVSGHALENSLQPENSVRIKPWQGEPDDTELLDIIPFLEYVAKNRPADTRTVVASYEGRDIAKEFMERSKEHLRRMQEQKQKQQGRFWRR